MSLHPRLELFLNAARHCLSLPWGVPFLPADSTPRSRGTVMKPVRADGRYRLAVASRALAAIGGGYALAAGWAAAFSLALAQLMPRVEAVLIATMLAWLAYAMAAGWAFYARTAWGAWGGTLLPALVLGACAMAPQWMGITP
jgi:hypothetical protein